MNKAKINILRLTPLTGFALAACGGGGGGGNVNLANNDSSSTVTGAVVKGPLSNALVFVDYDGDGKLDSDEPSVRTDLNGSYTLTSESSNAAVVAITDDSTLDTSSGAILSGVKLSAPAGASIVSPMTTLVQDGGLDTAQVSDVLGIPAGVNILTFNPYDFNGTASALVVEKIAQQLMTTINTIASSGEGAGASSTDAFSSALGSIISVVSTKANSSTRLDFTNSNDLSEIQTVAVSRMNDLNGIDTSLVNSSMTTAMTAVRNVNVAIDAISSKDLTSTQTRNIFSTSQVLKDQVKAAAEAGDSSLVTLSDDSAVNTIANESAPHSLELAQIYFNEHRDDLQITNILVSDIDSSVFTFRLSGTDAEWFRVSVNENGTGTLLFRATPDFETKSSFNFNLVVSDETGKSLGREFEISILDSIEEIGHVLKGPINGANIFHDTNDDGMLNQSENFVTSNILGEFNLSDISNNSGTLTALLDGAAVDTYSKMRLDGVRLTAPDGATVITPFTTIINESGIDQDTLKLMLELPRFLDLMHFNSFNTSADVSGSDLLYYESVAQRLMLIVRATSAGLEGIGFTAREAYEEGLTLVADTLSGIAENFDVEVGFNLQDALIDLSKAVETRVNQLLSADEITSAQYANISAVLLDDDSAKNAVWEVLESIRQESETAMNAGESLERGISDHLRGSYTNINLLHDQIVEAVAAGDPSLIILDNASAVYEATQNIAPDRINLYDNSSGAYLDDESNDLVQYSISDLNDLSINLVAEDDQGRDQLLLSIEGDDADYFEVLTPNEAKSQGYSDWMLVAKNGGDVSHLSELNITVIATDSGGKSFSRDLSIELSDAAITQSAEFSAGARVNDEFVFSFDNELISQAPSKSFSSSNLPSWLTLDTATGQLAGTPTTQDIGTTNLTISGSVDSVSVNYDVAVSVVSPLKSVVVLIDQFSDRIFDLGNDNVTLYDWGHLETLRMYDSSVDAYGYQGDADYDSYEVLSNDLLGAFYQVTPDSDSSIRSQFNAQTTNDWDYDLIGSGSFLDESGNTVFYDDYEVLWRHDQTSDTDVNHGDWSLYALLEQLDEPDNTEIICIDVDTLNGASSHYQNLFGTTYSAVDWLTNNQLTAVTNTEDIVTRWLANNDYRITGDMDDSDYSMAAVSVSIAGSLATTEIPTLDVIASLDIPIVQAAPNVNQGFFDWGSNYTDVINVGAWNEDTNGDLLVSSVDTYDTVDIVANGLVTKQDWGNNFGTSFATPRVAGEITNLTNQILDYLEASGLSMTEAQEESANSGVDYSDLINSIVEIISTEAQVGLRYYTTTGYETMNILTEDLLAAEFPVFVDSDGGIEGLEVVSVDLNDYVNYDEFLSTANGTEFV